MDYSNGLDDSPLQFHESAKAESCCISKTSEVLFIGGEGFLVCRNLTDGSVINKIINPSLVLSKLFMNKSESLLVAIDYKTGTIYTFSASRLLMMGSHQTKIQLINALFCPERELMILRTASKSLLILNMTAKLLTHSISDIGSNRSLFLSKSNQEVLFCDSDNKIAAVNLKPPFKQNYVCSLSESPLEIFVDEVRNRLFSGVMNSVYVYSISSNSLLRTIKLNIGGVGKIILESSGSYAVVSCGPEIYFLNLLSLKVSDRIIKGKGKVKDMQEFNRFLVSVGGESVTSISFLNRLEENEEEKLNKSSSAPKHLHKSTADTTPAKTTTDISTPNSARNGFDSPQLSPTTFKSHKRIKETESNIVTSEKNSIDSAKKYDRIEEENKSLREKIKLLEKEISLRDIEKINMINEIKKLKENANILKR